GVSAGLPSAPGDGAGAVGAVPRSVGVGAGPWPARARSAAVPAGDWARASLPEVIGVSTIWLASVPVTKPTDRQRSISGSVGAKTTCRARPPPDRDGQSTTRERH